MIDPRRRLNERLAAIELRLGELGDSGDISSREIRGQLRAERAALEGALAQYDAAEATREAARAQAANTVALEKATAQRERVRAEEDEASFWFRRVFTAAGVANAALFTACLASLIQVGFAPETARRVVDPMVGFAFGAGLAGLVPLALWIRARFERTFGFVLALAAALTSLLFLGVAARELVLLTAAAAHSPSWPNR